MMAIVLIDTSTTNKQAKKKKSQNTPVPKAYRKHFGKGVENSSKLEDQKIAVDLCLLDTAGKLIFVTPKQYVCLNKI